MKRVESSGPVLVVVLSPHMVYSMTEWPRMQAVAEAEGFRVIVWWSPQVSAQEAVQAAERASWPMAVVSRVSAVPRECTDWVGAPNHFPYSRVLWQGRTHAWPIWGVLPDLPWIESLQWRVRALEDAGTSP